MPRNATWSNSDGLVVGFGTHSADYNVPAVTGGSGTMKCATTVILWSDVPSNITFAQTDVKPQSIVLKRGTQILDATFQVTTAFTSGGAATLNIGTWGISDGDYSITPTVDVANGIDAAIALTAIDAVGAIVQCDGVLVNGVVSCGKTSLSNVVVSFANPTANALTAGEGVLTIWYIEPRTGDGTFDAVE